MTVARLARDRRRLLGVAVAGAWVAVPALAWLALAGRADRLATSGDGATAVPAGSGWAWFGAALAMIAVVGGMGGLAIADARRAAYEGPRAYGAMPAVLGVLTVIAWFAGGFVGYGVWVNVTDCGVGAAAPCVDHPGAVLTVLALLSWIAPTGVAPVLLWRGRRSRICALLAPPLVLGLYLLAIHLALPHLGFGDVTG